MNSISNLEVKMLLSALEDLLEIKGLIRHITPHYSLDEELNEKFRSLLKDLQLKLQPLFQTYLIQNNSNRVLKQKSITFLANLKETGSMILVSASSSKKALKKLGFDPQNIIVSGGPLIYEDYKKINPLLTDQALLGIKKKCQNLINLLQGSKIQRKELFFIYEAQNLTDKIILNEFDMDKSLLGKKVTCYDIFSWKEVENYSGL